MKSKNHNRTQVYEGEKGDFNWGEGRLTQRRGRKERELTLRKPQGNIIYKHTCIHTYMYI